MPDRVKEAAGEILRLAQSLSSENSRKADQVILELLREFPGKAVPTVERLALELREQLPFMKPEGREFLERKVTFLENQLENIEENS
jgi:hypothetical protein